MIRSDIVPTDCMTRPEEQVEKPVMAEAEAASLTCSSSALNDLDNDDLVPESDRTSETGSFANEYLRSMA